MPFNIQDEKLHKQLRNPIAPIFSLSSIIAYERFVDEVTELLLQQLDQRFVVSHETFDLGDWLEFFAFDVMGTMTFSKRYGFLENGKDDKMLMEAIWNSLTSNASVSPIRLLSTLEYRNLKHTMRIYDRVWLTLRKSQVSQMPWFDKIWNKNPIASIFRPPASLHILKVAQDAIDERKHMIATQKGFRVESEFYKGDMLARFLSAQEADESIPPW